MSLFWGVVLGGLLFGGGKECHCDACVKVRAEGKKRWLKYINDKSTGPSSSIALSPFGSVSPRSLNE